MIQFEWRPRLLANCLLFACWFAFTAYGIKAQCPTQEQIVAVRDSGKVMAIRELSDQLRNCTGSVDTVAAALHHALSLKYFDVNPDSGAFYTRRALAIRQRLFGESPTEDLGKSYHNLGVFLNEGGNLRQAVDPFEQAVSIFEELAIGGRLHRSRLQLSQVFGRLGNYNDAKSLLIAAIDASEGDNYALAQANHNLGLLWQQQDSLLQAAEALRLAANYYLNDPDPDYWYYTNCILTLATVTDQLGDFPTATEYYLTALRMYSEFDDPVGVALTSNSLGLAYVENKRTKLGFQYLQRGLNVSKKAGLPRMEAQAHDHFGEYYLAINRPEQAVLAFQRAQQTLVPGYEAADVFSVPTKEQLDYANEIVDLLKYISDQAKGLEVLYEKEGKEELLTAALNAYRQGDFLIDRLRADHDGMATKLIWREKATRLYEAAIKLCFKTGNGKDAYYFFEKSKAILLYEAMVEGDALSQLPDTLRQQERQLSAAVETARIQLQEQDKGAQANYTDFLRAREQREQFRATLGKEYPAFRSMNVVAEVTPWEQLNAEVLLPTGQWMVQYFMGRQNTYALVIEPGGPSLHDLGKTEVIQTQVDALLDYFTSSSKIANDPGGYTAQANQLYLKLMEPLALPQDAPLLVVADGVLTYLPFSALTTTAEFPGSFGALPTLLQRHQVSYGYSATTLLRQQQLPARKSTAFAAFAPFGDGSSPTKYPRLDFSRDELSTLSEVFSIDMHANKEATRNQFLKAPQEYRILHLSTHAFSSPREKAPHIAFYDSLLYLQDVYQLPLTADLVVLSACQTNIGKNAPGEGTLGLGRGFAQAGARGIVSSLWNVNATSTGRVLEHFYQALNQQTSAGKALHNAKINYCANASIPDVQKSPYYWAGLTYYGSEQMIELESTSSNLMYLTLLLPLVIVGVIALVRTYS